MRTNANNVGYIVAWEARKSQGGGRHSWRCSTRDIADATYLFVRIWFRPPFVEMIKPDTLTVLKKHERKKK